jgi:Ni,Fe-hydrogenase III component G
MAEEENITQELASKFSFLAGNIQIPRQRRISAQVGYGNFPEVFAYAVNQLRFVHLCTITGLDEGENLGLIYHLAQDSGVLLNLKTAVPKNNPLVKTITANFAGGEIYERELMDLLGVKVEGLASGNRYPLTDDWPLDQHPLRKDWKSSIDKQNGGK